MGKVSLDPYLFFKGNAREAMEFYKSVFGGELTVQTVADAPDFPGKENLNGNHVMHSSLEGGDIKLMASDSPMASEKTAKIELSLGGGDEQKLRGYFEALSAGGKVRSPLKTESWGDTFGMLTDKFGVDWMININANKE